MKLYPVTKAKRGNRFCGPAVISALTRMTTDEAARLIRAVSPHRVSVMGTHTGEILRALDKCGVRSAKIWNYRGKDRPTLAQWLAGSVDLRTDGRVFLIAAGNHWQLVSGRRYVCGQTIEIVSIKHEKVKRRARVSLVVELHAPAGVTIPGETKKPADPDAALRRKAKALADEHDIELETLRKDRDGFTIGVFPPDGLYAEEGEDPFDGDHYCTDWFDILEMVERYVADAQRLKTAA